MTSSSLPLADLIRVACQLEVLAPKPGNVHPEADFADVHAGHFLKSAEVVAPILAAAAECGVGAVILESVRAVRESVGTNTNLGILLLIAPLAAVAAGTDCQTGIGDVLTDLTAVDAVAVFEAIHLAQPGGLGNVAEHDVAEPPCISLHAAMSLAAHRDAVARQYVTDFEDLFGPARGVLLESLTRGCSWDQAIVRAHLWLMADSPDTLIQRKCGPAVARESQLRAQQVWEADWPFGEQSAAKLAALDDWLRGDGHRRNPGTTADLIAALLFATLRDGDWTPPTAAEIAPLLEKCSAIHN